MRFLITAIAFLAFNGFAVCDDAAKPMQGELKDGEKRVSEGVVRILNDVDDLFPKDPVRIDFDKDPDGEVPDFRWPGTDISTSYVPLGCTFATSFADSYVGVQPYNVGGRSGGRCAATHKPLYQGIITIRFCKPGDATIPANVTTVGFWTSHVAPGGTALEAYDVENNKIAEIKTLKLQREFLAIRSKTPIAYIKIVPDNNIDPDYAIDDLVFDTPTPIMIK